LARRTFLLASSCYGCKHAQLRLYRGIINANLFI
jgi:hypothetical protein